MTASLPTGPPRSSLFNRLRGPFASKQNPQIKQEVQLDSPFREYAPGDSITGRVHLDVPKPVRATHLVVRLHGFVKVVTHSKLPGEAIPYDENLLNSTKGRKGGEYFGNGFAKLFEDEHVLCGDGRLLGKYDFQFEVILPQRDIPSSIDFENGTITYLLTSTLTRPTTISPTLVEHCKLKVKENIDIARIPKPRPQSVSLETLGTRRPVMHMKRRVSGSTNGNDQTSARDEARENFPASPSSTVEAPGSPGPSEMSSPSHDSSSTSITHSGTNLPTAQDTRSITSGIFSFAASDKTITAQTEVLQGGCLPGDIIPVRVSVDHTKSIKSMQGVIVTFYRLARIDTHPALPLGPSNESSNAKYEDYYPKSRTGLGGLSLSSAGSSRTFRQDLSQNITPLIVDPITLTAILKTSVQVPEHVFPSISGVPGSMISFKYFVEIVIDLRGRLGQDRILPKFSLTNTPQHAYEDPKINVVDGRDGFTFSTTPGFNFLITDQIRRQKGVVYTKTEVLLGTKDSNRFRGKQKAYGVSNSTEVDHVPAHLSDSHLPMYQSKGNQGSESASSAQGRQDQPNNSHRRSAIPPPTPLAEPLDEKARIRQAEETLLPGAPPNEGAPSSGAGQAPSAPAAFDEDELLRQYNQASAPEYEGRHFDSEARTIPGSSSSLTSRIDPSGVAAATTADSRQAPDKQEPEHQKLQQLTSSPEQTSCQESADTQMPLPGASDSVSNNHSSPNYYGSSATIGQASSSPSSLEQTPSLPVQGVMDQRGPDKQEAERLRLHQMISSPNDEALDGPVGNTPVPSPSAPILNDSSGVFMRQHEDYEESHHEALPVYRR